MTKERSHTDTDGVADPLVSRTYRESAEERTPPELDQAVLRQARRNSSSRYSRSVLWLRPMAWATTIALCLAIVVEVADLPQLDSDMMPMPALPKDATGIKADLEAHNETDVLEEIRVERANSDEVPKADEEARYEPELLQQRARKTIDEDGRVHLQSVPQLSKTAPEQAINMPAAAVAPARAAEADYATKRQVADTGSFADTDSFERNDSPIIEEADALARMHEGKNKESDDKTSYVSSLGLVAAETVSAPCDEETQADPESWLECIEALEDDGLDDLASLQREQLQEAFPDFPLP